MRKPEINFTQNRYFEGISQSWLGGIYPIKKPSNGAFGFALNYLSVSAFDAYDGEDNKIGSVSARSLAAYFSYARALNLGGKHISAFFCGANLKYIKERLASEKASGFALDLGLMAKVEGIENLKFAVMAENIASNEIRFIDKGYRLPFNLKFGSSYKLSGKDKGYRVNFSLDFNFPQDNHDYVAAGIESGFNDVFTFRAGYNSFGDLSNGINLGFGIEAGKYLGRDIGINYSFGDSYDFGNIHKVDITYKFEKNRVAPEYSSSPENAPLRESIYEEPTEQPY